MYIYLYEYLYMSKTYIKENEEEGYWLARRVNTSQH